MSITSREYPQTPLVGVGAAIVKGGLILIVRRGKEPGYGQWSIPGGVVELGETTQEATAREVMEECSLAIRVADLIGVYDRIRRDPIGIVQYHYILVDYLAYWISGDLTLSDELLEARWISESDISNIPLDELTLDMLLHAFALIR